MSKRRRVQPGYTSQGVRDLSFVKVRDEGIVRIKNPMPEGGPQCDHDGSVREVDALAGISQCHKCRQSWDFNGDPI